jgi:ABC-2 type transport system permease protein/sodium transport system permease protein
MLVMPVANMVLLAREVLLGAIVPLSATAMVLLSTILYAASAVAVAASLFGKESVVFADSGSLRTALSRRFIKPRAFPTVSMALLFVAVLFPVWFFVQSALSPSADESAIGLLRGTGAAMPVLFFLVPVGLLIYRKIDLRQTLCLKRPAASHMVAAVLIGISAWIPAHELSALQQLILPLPTALKEGAAQMQQALASLHPAEALLYLALAPALCEELVFRGFLLSGLTTAIRRWPAILISAAIFGVFHFALFKFASATALGIVLGYLCIRSGSLLPGIVAHLLHNGLSITTVYWPELWHQTLGISSDESSLHLPVPILLVGCAAFVGGVLLPKLPTNEMPRPVPGILADSAP